MEGAAVTAKQRQIFLSTFFQPTGLLHHGVCSDGHVPEGPFDQAPLPPPRHQKHLLLTEEIAVEDTWRLLLLLLTSLLVGVWRPGQCDAVDVAGNLDAGLSGGAETDGISMGH